MATGCSLVLLAGGQSRRMGRDKALLPAGERTMLAHLVDRLGPVADEVIVAGPPTLAMAGVRLIGDRYPGRGPLAGIHAGLLSASQPRAWVVGCDLPDVEPALGPFLLGLADGYEAVVPRVAGEPQAVCAIYQRSLIARLESALEAGEHSVKRLLHDCRVRYVSADEVRAVDPDLRSFRNLNTPADYQAWLRSSRPQP
jgi:molybdopterin-guanine dinucleotide biosynthesis protein A